MLKWVKIYLYRVVETSNEQTLGSYRQSESDRHSKLEQLLSGHVQVQTDYCSQARATIDNHAERRADERSQLTATFAETVGKLIQNMGDIERLTSEHMYSEQTWVEQLLKRVRNEADTATNEFHAYLVDQLLTVSTKILSALQQQDKAVQELGTKLDKNFAGLEQKLDIYLADQAKLRESKATAESNFYAGLERRNAALTSNFNDDIEATEEYIKKSNAFNEQIMSLLRAKAKEEQEFLTRRNSSTTEALTITEATMEATNSAQAESQESTLKFVALEGNFKNDNGEILQRMKSDKSGTMEEINQAGQAAAKATSVLRSEAEAFAQKAKDQWANHYARTEASLREKSDQSSTHVAGLQSMTGQARKAMLEGQSNAEDAIESWRRSDDKATRTAHESAASQCADLTGFGTKLRDEIRAAGHAVSNLVEKQMKRDVPTGQTPGRVAREFPRNLVEGTPDEIRKRRFREHFNLTGLAAKMDFDGSDADLVIEEDLNSEASHDDTKDSVFESNLGSGSLSRQDSGGSLTQSRVTARPATKKTSRTNLSEASVDTGILGDLDNKENFNDDNFTRPQRPSKLKQPESYTERSSRSSSRNRQKVVN